MDFKNVDLENFDYDSLSDAEFREFLSAWSDHWGRLNRVSVEELEKEFDRKSDYLLCGEHYELGEIYIEEFIELLFERKVFERGEGIIPFEEVQSYEYRLWLDQKIRNKAHRSESSPSDSIQSDKIDYSGYRMWRYNPVVFYKDGKSVRMILIWGHGMRCLMQGQLHFRRFSAVLLKTWHLKNIVICQQIRGTVMWKLHLMNWKGLLEDRQLSKK